ncbi:MAG: CRISPR-associated protein [Candidatus Adiutrix sp.]|jgi:CRISPR/Cas system-associated endonuclease/helicase Cas3|nr:CRISPR-associated protein [Candidatus Adiutrix sp.]
MKYYAHSPRDGIPAQAYETHVSGVEKRAVKYADDLARYAKLDGKLLSRAVQKAASFHDLGKLDSANQEVLSGEKTARSLPQNHVDAGAAHFLAERHFSIAAAAAIEAHHIGFPDFIKEQNRGDAAFRDANIKAEVDAALPRLESIHDGLTKTDFSPETDEIEGDKSVFFRLLLSCLADADHSDTAAHYKKRPEKDNAVFLSPAERLRRLDEYVAGLGRDDCERAALRGEMYAACRAADVTSGVCSCDSPVGSGKTTAVMAHLLVQAKKRKLRRIFVVLPFTNIIRQSVDIYRKALVLPGEKAEDVVAELHHRADFESEEARRLTALWRAPIIVTTAVTFFETLASNTPATLRRLHELPGSAIFVDESHAALPARLLPLAWKWMNTYAKEWSCYWVLASGSQNRFWSLEEIAAGDLATDMPELVNDHLRKRLAKYEKQRIEYKCDLTPKSPEELAEWIAGFPGPRLAALNTVQNAAILADYFREHFGREHVEHLSTALTAADREKTLTRVQERLRSAGDADWTFVATSCVEAGVDLSFKTGFRELASLASLLQAAGRVNREGLYGKAEIWTFCTAEGGPFNANPGLKGSAEVLRRYFKSGAEIQPGLSAQAISDELKLCGLAKKSKNLLRDEKNWRFPLVESAFKVIETNARIAVVEKALADEIRRGGLDWRELQNNSVQIAKYKLDEMRAPEVLAGIFYWELGYDAFLGYMAGLVQLKKFEGAGMIL